MRRLCARSMFAGAFLLLSLAHRSVEALLYFAAFGCVSLALLVERSCCSERLIEGARFAFAIKYRARALRSFLLALLALAILGLLQLVAGRAVGGRNSSSR